MPVNDFGESYRYPDVVRSVIEEQDLESYRRAADFLNTSNVDIVSVQHTSSGFSADRPAVTYWPCYAS